MNLARGFARVLIVVTLIYWGAALVSAAFTYDQHMSDAAAAQVYCRPSASPLAGSPCVFDPSAARKGALVEAGGELFVAGIVYAAFAAAIAALRWIIAGFRSPGAPQ